MLGKMFGGRHMTKSHAVVTFQDEVGEIQPVITHLVQIMDLALSSVAKISFNSG